jgi:hypothetical protein
MREKIERGLPSGLSRRRIEMERRICKSKSLTKGTVEHFYLNN